MDINAFIEIGFIGAVLSYGFEYVSGYFKSPQATKVVFVLLSLFIGLAYYALTLNAALHEAVFGVLTSASAVYALFIKK